MNRSRHRDGTSLNAMAAVLGALEPTLGAGLETVAGKIVSRSSRLAGRVTASRGVARRGVGRDAATRANWKPLQAQPEVLYHVYFDPPEKSTPDKGGGYCVGTISFFDALELDHGDGAHARHGSGEDKFYSFDVSDLLRRLGGSKSLSEKPTVTIAPAGEPASAARPVVGTIELLQQ